MSIFSCEVRDKLYKDTADIISTYLKNDSSDTLQKYDVILGEDLNFKNVLECNYKIVKIIEFEEILQKIKNRLDRNIKFEDIIAINQVSGRINIKKYIQTQYKSPSFKKIIPCIKIAEDYDIDVNIWLFYILKLVLSEIDNIGGKDIILKKKIMESNYGTRLRKLEINLTKLLYAGDYKKISQFINNSRIDILKLKIAKLSKKIIKEINNGRINKRIYMPVAEWYNSFILEVRDNINIQLLFYNESFDDKLYEIWILEKLKSSFIQDFNMRIIKANPMWLRLEEPIYTLEFTSEMIKNIIRIYYQKSKNIMWDDDILPKWIRTETVGNKFLQGNLDIIVTCDDSEKYDPVMIDAKNIEYYIKDISERINPAVTDKIYKMIGYMDNFNKKIAVKKEANGIIVFKDNKTVSNYKQLYENDSKDAKISVFTLNPQDESNINVNGLSKYIMNCFGMTSERINITNQLRNTLDGSIVKNEEENEKQIDKLYSQVSNSIKIIARGKEDNIAELQNSLKYNIFGEDIWTYIDADSKRLLAQGEFLITALDNCNNLEYSMMGINYTKSIEYVVYSKLINRFKEFLLLNNKSSSDLAVNNILTGKQSTLGQISILIKNCNESTFVEFISFLYHGNDLNNNIKAVKDFGVSLHEFTQYRNKLAHKDGVSKVVFDNIRDRVLGIGLHTSLIKKLYKLLKI